MASRDRGNVSGVEVLMRQAAVQIGAGGSAGFVEVCIMHPLDLVKTRLQLQNKGKIIEGVTQYKGVFDCFRQMYAAEGVRSFYKGIIPPIVAETPKRATKFFTFEQYKKLFLFGSPEATPITFSLAGLGAGITEAILVNPFEVVKVKMQSDRSVGAARPSTWQVTREIYRQHGFGGEGLNKGLTSTIGRNGLFNCIYFGFYHSVKGFLPEYEDGTLEFFRKVGIGFVSGVLASVCNIPMDVAKSRIQGPQAVGAPRYHGCVATMLRVYNQEGFLALYQGLLPKVMRLGPGGAIMLVVYDYMHQYLSGIIELK